MLQLGNLKLRQQKRFLSYSVEATTNRIRSFWDDGLEYNRE